MTFIKRPGNGRASYALIVDGKTVDDARVAAVNRDLAAGIPSDELDLRMRRILDEFRPRPSKLQSLSGANQRLVDEIMESKLLHKDLIRPEWARGALLRSANALGNLSIHTASKLDLLRVTKRYDGYARWHVARGINEMLKFIGRPERLPQPRPYRNEIKYIRVSDFLEAIKPLPPEYRAVLGALFGIGCRWAELYCAEFDEKSAYVRQQMRPDGSIRPRKNKKPSRNPFIMPLKSLIMAYTALPESFRGKVATRGYKSVYRAFKRIAPNLTLHDLRHSYAVELRSIGVSTAKIADYLGDDVETARRHYINFCATDEEMDRVASLWG